MTEDAVTAAPPDLRGPKRGVIAATAAVTVAGMPSFLTGASSTMMAQELGFGADGLGYAIAVYFLVCAVASPLGGHLSEWLGPSASLRLVALGSSVVMLAIAGLARSFTHLLVLLGFAGAVNGVAQPASNLALARTVDRRPALMFGIKQSAVPMATLLAGASVPLVGVVLGWRWSFAAAALFALLTIGLVPPMGPPRRYGREARMLRPRTVSAPLVAVAVASGFGTAAATAMGIFLVGSAVASGTPLGLAGWLMTAGSVIGVLARILAGWLSDTGRVRALLSVGLMLCVGSAGYLLIITGNTPLLVLGTILAYGFGWGWTGLMMFAVVRIHPEAPAVATGIVGAGASAGAALGPLAFGLVVASAGYDVAWMAAAAASLVSGILIIGARVMIIRMLSRRGDPEQLGDTPQ